MSSIGLTTHSRIFHSYEDVTITDEGRQILTYTRHSWPLRTSLPHLLWHRTSVYNDHLRRPVILILVFERLAVELPLPVFRLRSVAGSRLLFEHPAYRMRGERSNGLRQSGCRVRSNKMCLSRAPILYLTLTTVFDMNFKYMSYWGDIMYMYTISVRRSSSVVCLYYWGNLLLPKLICNNFNERGLKFSAINKYKTLKKSMKFLKSKLWIFLVYNSMLPLKLDSLSLMSLHFFEGSFLIVSEKYHKEQ